MHKPIEQLLAGAVAGLTATVPMTAFMEVTHRMLPRGRHPLPPRLITEQGTRQAGIHHELSEPGLVGVTLAAHLGYGTATGAIYGLAAPYIALPPVASGVAYGLAVWAGSYLGLLPAAGILPPATRDYPERNAVMIGAHVVWGAALGYYTHRYLAHCLAEARDAESQSQDSRGQTSDAEAREEMAW